MALRRRKIELKRGKKTAKRKKRKTTILREAALSSITNRVATAQALQAPLYECWERKGLFEPNAGIGTVVVTRKTLGNQVLMAAFLVDVFCLGIKDAHCMLLNENEYRFRLQQIETHENLSEIHPACAKKLVKGAQIYAEGLGFSAHRDYGFAKRIFGDIQEKQCPRSFTFGRDGKPMYLAGPNDNPQFSKKVVNTLTTNLGKHGFHFLMPVKGSQGARDQINMAAVKSGATTETHPNTKVVNIFMLPEEYPLDVTEKNNVKALKNAA